MALLLDAPRGSLLERTLAHRPALFGFVQAPYLNAAWDADTRIARFARHVAVLETLGGGFDFDVTQSIELLSLDAVAPGWHVVLDKPVWLQREGVLSLNLFKDNVRWFSVAFAIDVEDGERSVMIGGIQGRNLPGALDAYRDLTKLAHGIRPRDLAIELLRMLADAIRATRILAVSDACRHHRSAFFGAKAKSDLPLDYDEIWRDRGGVEGEGGFFVLPVERQQRAIEEIPAKKRQMYRRRYEMLDALETTLRSSLATSTPRLRPEAE